MSVEALAADLELVLAMTAEKMGWAELPALLLVGHSLGGAVVTHVAKAGKLGAKVLGFAVLDVVEGMHAPRPVGRIYGDVLFGKTIGTTKKVLMPRRIRDGCAQGDECIPRFPASELSVPRSGYRMAVRALATILSYIVTKRLTRPLQPPLAHHPRSTLRPHVRTLLSISRCTDPKHRQRLLRHHGSVRLHHRLPTIQIHPLDPRRRSRPALTSPTARAQVDATRAAAQVVGLARRPRGHGRVLGELVRRDERQVPDGARRQAAAAGGDGSAGQGADDRADAG